MGRPHVRSAWRDDRRRLGAPDRAGVDAEGGVPLHPVRGQGPPSSGQRDDQPNHRQRHGRRPTTATTSTTASTDRVSGIDLHALRFGITHYFGSEPWAVIAPAFPLPTKGPRPVVASLGWTGLYGGVSFGAASLQATTSALAHAVTVTDTFGATSVQTTIEDTRTNGSGRNWGGLADIYLGYHARFGSNVIAGLQVEGTIANNQVTLNTSQVQLRNQATTTTPPGTTATVSRLFTVTGIDALAERWAVSVLARAGWLIDPRDLVYVIGGYTYGGFEWGDRVFGLNGATVGGGWEHQIAPAWTLKAEYRYARFEDQDLTRTASLAQPSTLVGGGLTGTNVTASTTANTDRVSEISQHALRVGLTHYFDSDAAAAAPGATAMVVKAPPPVAAVPSWAGPYAGVSFGVTSMEVATHSPHQLAGQRCGDGSRVCSNPGPGHQWRVQHARPQGRRRRRCCRRIQRSLRAEGRCRRAGRGKPGAGDGDGRRNVAPGFHPHKRGHAARRRGRDHHTDRYDRRVDHIEHAGPLDDIGAGASRLADRSARSDLCDRRMELWPFHQQQPGVRLARADSRGRHRAPGGPVMDLKAEYRYSHFLAKDVPLALTQNRNFTSATLAQNISVVSSQVDRIAVNMHTVRLGISHYFSSR